MNIDSDLPIMAGHVLDRFRADGGKIVTAESCTGGLIAALLTSVPGSSDVVDRGFVTYSNESKHEILGVSQEVLDQLGAVSMEAAAEMASGALARSNATAAVAVTGIAGPGGATAGKPVGLVHIAVASIHEEGAFAEEFRFGDIGRDHVRNMTVKAAFEMLLAYGIRADDQ